MYVPLIYYQVGLLLNDKEICVDTKKNEEGKGNERKKLGKFSKPPALKMYQSVFENLYIQEAVFLKYCYASHTSKHERKKLFVRETVFLKYCSHKNILNREFRSVI